MCSSFSFAQFIVSRIVLGFGTGGIIATTSVWQSELSKASSRGSHVSAFGIFAGIGLVLALWIDFGTSYASSSFSWRFSLAFPMLLSFIVMSTIYTLPESPRWLMKVGRDKEAANILQLLHEDPRTVEKELNDIRVSLDLSGNVGLRSLLNMGTQRVFHRVIIGCMAQAMLQLTGVMLDARGFCALPPVVFVTLSLLLARNNEQCLYVEAVCSQIAYMVDLIPVEEEILPSSSEQFNISYLLNSTRQLHHILRLLPLRISKGLLD